jgi:UDP-N-acetylglucosamine acyltransferase
MSGLIQMHETSREIHSTAVIHPGAQLAEAINIGPYAIVEDGVSVGAGCEIGPHAVIRRGSLLEDSVKIDAHAVIGGLPQDFKFDPDIPSFLRVGSGSVLREGVTAHRSTRENGETLIGKGCFLMAYAHVGHDCRIGNRVVVANNVMFAGHVTVEDDVIFGGAVAIHQFARVGEGAMISGVSRVSRDAPRYCIFAERDELHGLNIIGLRRRGHSREAIRELRELYFQVFRAAGGPVRSAGKILQENQPQTLEGRRFLEFMVESKRGLARPPSL